ncbi:hypothetical protein ASPCADRAFT_135666, partial [Aspergillus carbonarius ITEM 5010]
MTKRQEAADHHHEFRSDSVLSSPLEKAKMSSRGLRLVRVVRVHHPLGHRLDQLSTHLST